MISPITAPGLMACAFFEVDFGFRVADRVHDLELHPRLELGGFGVDLDLELLAGIHALLGGRLEGGRDRGDHVGAADALLLLHVFQDGKDFAAHGIKWMGESGKKRRATRPTPED